MNALARLGMVSDSPSEAQTIDRPGTECSEDRKDYFVERNGVRFAGTHLLVDLWGASRLDDPEHIDTALRAAAEAAGATILHGHFHHFTPNGGVSGVAVLSESHISIHSWPEADYAALDVFMCGNAKPHLAIDVLRSDFQADEVVVREHLRGRELHQVKWQAAASPKAPYRMGKVRTKKAA